MRSTLRLVLPPFVAGKLVALLVPMLTVWSTAQGAVSYADLMRPFASWDGATYLEIARNGYPSGPLDLTPGHPGHIWGFFPGVPLLVRIAHLVIPDWVTAGVLVNVVTELVALYFLARLVLLERGDEDSARFSVWLLALFPYAVFLTAVYTEAPFLAAATASLYYARRGSNLPASFAAAIAMAMRISGVPLIPALLIEYLRRRGWRPGFGLLPIAASVLPILLFAWYAQHLTGDAFAYQHVQQSASYGSRTNTWPSTALWNTWQIASGSAGGNSYIFTMEVVFGVVAASGGAGVRSALQAIAGAGWQGEVVVGDNGSADGSREVARDAGARVIDVPRRGYGAAIDAGMLVAGGRVLVMADADGTYPMESLPALVAPVLDGERDMVIGARLHDDTAARTMPWLHRHVGTPVLTRMVNRLSGATVSDSQSGMCAISHEPYARVGVRTPGLGVAL